MGSDDIPNEEMKVVYVSRQSRLNEDLAKNLDELLSMASPQQYQDAILKIYYVYLLHQHQNLPPNFPTITKPIVMLLDFLKKCERE